MATKNEVRGVTAKRERPVVIPKPYTPENQHISKEEFLRRRKTENEANAAGEEARLKVLRERGVIDAKGQKAPAAKENEAEEVLVKLRKDLATAQQKLDENPTSKAMKKKVQEISDKIEAAEIEADR